MSNRYVIPAIVLIALPLVVRAQEAATPENGMPVLDILAMGGWITWPIYGLLLIGIALSLSRFLHLRLDSGRDSALRAWSPKGKKPEEALQQLRGMDQGSLTLAARDMLSQFTLSGLSEGLQSRIEHHVTIKQDGFKPYTNWMQFLSESAGALGLLGTVLGMFQTFFGGTLDKDKILHGMGVALITTLVGILVSLLLNLGLILLRNHFDRMLDTHYRKLTEIRQAMQEQTARKQG